MTILTSILDNHEAGEKWCADFSSLEGIEVGLLSSNFDAIAYADTSRVKKLSRFQHWRRHQTIDYILQEEAEERTPLLSVKPVNSLISSRRKTYRRAGHLSSRSGLVSSVEGTDDNLMDSDFDIVAQHSDLMSSKISVKHKLKPERTILVSAIPPLKKPLILPSRKPKAKQMSRKAERQLRPASSLRRIDNGKGVSPSEAHQAAARSHCYCSRMDTNKDLRDDVPLWYMSNKHPLMKTPQSQVMESVFFETIAVGGK